jgi:hypothetical protein
MVPSSIEDADGPVGKMGETPIGTPARLELAGKKSFFDRKAFWHLKVWIKETERMESYGQGSAKTQVRAVHSASRTASVAQQPLSGWPGSEYGSTSRSSKNWR